MIRGWIVWVDYSGATRWDYVKKGFLTVDPDEAEVFKTRKKAEAAAFAFAVKRPEYIDHIGVRSVRDEYGLLEERPLQ